MPLLVRSVGAGIAWTLELNTRPWLVKNSIQSWVPATSRCSTAASSTVRAPVVPLPPRRARADDGLPPPGLAPVRGQRLALDVAALRNGHDDVFVGDEVLVGQLAV